MKVLKSWSILILGFLGCQINSSANFFIGHTFSGALQMWYKDKVDGQWHTGVTVGGHASSVEDLDWEPSKGMYVNSEKKLIDCSEISAL